jgi:hypothetical protein
MTRTVSRRPYLIGLLLLCGLALLYAAPAALSQDGSPKANKNLADRVAALEARIGSLEAENAALKHKTKYLSVVGTETYFTGTNLHLRNGLGATNGNPDQPYQYNDAFFQTNGLGNLIIGYNEASLGGSRDGSHNLVIGVANNYTSAGCLVVGHSNTVSGPYASVSGGAYNVASGRESSVSAGIQNSASGDGSSVSGGSINTASGAGAGVGSGYQNTASGQYATVSGGRAGTASGQYATVSGGRINTASAPGSAVSGGFGNVASGSDASVGGGLQRSASGQYDWRAGNLSQDQ